MKNLVIILVLVLIAVGAFFALKGPDLTPKESEYLDFKLGAKPSPEMKATSESDTFKTKGEIYYSVFSIKPFEAAATVEVVIKNTADMSKVLFTEALGTTPEKKIMRPINPVNSDAAGKYVIELVKDGAVIARKVFTVSDNAPAPAAPAVPEAPAAPATGEVKVEAPVAPAAEVPAAPAAPATGEVKTN